MGTKFEKAVFGKNENQLAAAKIAKILIINNF